MRVPDFLGCKISCDTGFVDAGFILALPFHHGDLEPDCAGVSTRGWGGGLCAGRAVERIGRAQGKYKKWGPTKWIV